MTDLSHLEGRRFCVVFVKVIDPETERVRLQCLHGRASVDSGGVALVTDEGSEFRLPGAAVSTIMPADGTAMLKNAEYFAMVRLGPGVKFFNEETHDGNG